MPIILPLMLAAAVPGAGKPQVPVVPAFFNGERLYEICNRPNNGQCSMYVAGVIDGVFLLESESADSTICRAPINNRQAASLVTSYLGAHPELRTAAAAVGVRAAIKETLGCGVEPSVATPPPVSPPPAAPPSTAP